MDNTLITLKDSTNGDDIYTISLENGAYIITPIKPITDILTTTLTIHNKDFGNLGDLNICEILLGALTDKLYKNLRLSQLWEHHKDIENFIYKPLPISYRETKE
jgi:hypothetical protein